MTMCMRKDEAAKLLPTNTGRIHLPKTGPRCRRGRENILLHAAEETSSEKRVEEMS